MNKILKFIKGKTKLKQIKNYYEYKKAQKYFNFKGSDKDYLVNLGKFRLKKIMNLDNPKTFNEKVNWLKLYDKNQLYPILADKYLVKFYISKTIGEQYVIKTLQVYDRADDIDFSILPSKFVLKCNHDSGSVIIVRDKNQINEDVIKKKLNKKLDVTYSDTNKEWVYSKINRKIICEEYLEQEGSDSLTDYKFYCFNGEPKFLYVSKGLENHSTATISFYDMKMNLLPFHRPDFKQNKEGECRPKNWEEMIQIARKLSNGIPFVRVDLYSIQNKIYFSEFTFFPCGGFMRFVPDRWDLLIGNMLELPKNLTDEHDK